MYESLESFEQGSIPAYVLHGIHQKKLSCHSPKQIHCILPAEIIDICHMKISFIRHPNNHEIGKLENAWLLDHCLKSVQGIPLWRGTLQSVTSHFRLLTIWREVTILHYAVLDTSTTLQCACSTNATAWGLLFWGREISPSSTPMGK